MRYYFIKYYTSFSNTYILRHAPKEMLQKMLDNGFTRITRKEAIRHCVEERRREKFDKACSGYANRCIYPIEWEDEHGDIPMVYNYNKQEYIVEV